ncbi:tyrosine-type recombinase/integrase [Lentibacillus sp. CBA3610]|uniref:tyrosine-type recombinase/integrase n=1 Tax=Lentibacillus sp. CBA3610 TaxID=2518176 RepID=UPI00159552B9|nr:tyrosine-type recombinase/integrase [Lentibacillus sp. CBA3610]QKY71304.1 integrase [Lentibacillus sp. CBA3610]
MELSGVNAYLIEQYIAFKRNMGYALSNTYNFKTFDDFTINNGATSIGLTKGLAEKWKEKRPNESDVTRYKRVNDIANFCIYLNQLGYQSYIPRTPKKYQTTFTPYIFSKDELKSFFTACDTIKVNGKSNMKFILPVVFRVIYGCGLRINEVMSLKNKDVNLDENYIIVRETKNGCDRILPLSDSLITICKQYKVHISSNDSEGYFFIQLNGNRYAPDTVYRWFRKILWEAGISHGGKGLGPRVHDLSYPNLNKIQTFLIKSRYFRNLIKKRFGFYSFIV